MPHRQQTRGSQAAGQGVKAQQFRILATGKHGIGDGHRGHGEKNEPRRSQMKNAGSSPKREIRDAGTQRLQAVGKGGESLAAKALRPSHQRRRRRQADPDPDWGPNPVAIKGQLQKPGHADEHGKDTDTVQELGPDPAFERRPASPDRRLPSPPERRVGVAGSAAGSSGCGRRAEPAPLPPERRRALTIPPVVAGRRRRKP